MPLFSSDDISNSSVPKSDSGSILTKGTVSFWHRTQQKIAAEFKDLEIISGLSKHFVSKGAWSMHDLIYYFLKIEGPSRVFITPWAISEIAMRNLFNFMNDGLITELYMICDYRNTSRKPAELAFIERNASKITLAKCHAKVVVIVPEDPTQIPLTIVSSANLTRNPRLEAGVVTFSKAVADFHKDWINEEISNTDA